MTNSKDANLPVPKKKKSKDSELAVPKKKKSKDSDLAVPKKKRKRSSSNDVEEEEEAPPLPKPEVVASRAKSHPKKVEGEVKDSRPLSSFSEGALVSNVETRVGRGPQLARAPGASVVIVSHNPENGTTVVKLPSGAKTSVKSACCAVMGRVPGAGKPEKKKPFFVKKKKAPENDEAKRKCLTKKVDAVATNPVDGRSKH